MLFTPPSLSTLPFSRLFLTRSEGGSGDRLFLPFISLSVSLSLSNSLSHSLLILNVQSVSVLLLLLLLLLFILLVRPSDRRLHFYRASLTNCFCSSLRCIALLTQFPCHSRSFARPSASVRRPQLSTAIRAPPPHRALIQSAATII